jgi:hypothetical protein
MELAWIWDSVSTEMFHVEHPRKRDLRSTWNIESDLPM